MVNKWMFWQRFGEDVCDLFSGRDNGGNNFSKFDEFAYIVETKFNVFGTVGEDVVVELTDGGRVVFIDSDGK